MTDCDTETTQAEVKIIEDDGWVVPDSIWDNAIEGLTWALLNDSMDISEAGVHPEVYDSAVDTAKKLFAERTKSQF